MLGNEPDKRPIMNKVIDKLNSIIAKTNTKEFDQTNQLETKLLSSEHLNSINAASGYCHKDFHSGNILQLESSSFVSDFGFTGLADKTKSDDQIYGVLPYIAPEILNGESYTLASDIYSFGIIMAELSTGNPPFYNRKHNISLALNICNGLRPEFGKETPEFYKELAYRCMNSNPNQRPT
ncbi:4228_t:CDS:2 [Funneliformis geosporum]|uniref:8108_t:CDS:1 n=1 Tax=Funneliformis geosporum TaxID=1117311 RepID=A0A9W4STV5_9GLOM|nr:4228_t:CDS:2 [Funneliformis geosporum]CAI2180358.1 8108_t:CDS:2 [Funneliformis geosporum]